jgi:hypothetical protein
MGTKRLVQIRLVRGDIKRVPPGETPIIELQLEPHERVLDIELARNEQHGRALSERKTYDWTWVAYVETQL